MVWIYFMSAALVTNCNREGHLCATITPETSHRYYFTQQAQKASYKWFHIKKGHYAMAYIPKRFVEPVEQNVQL